MRILLFHDNLLYCSSSAIHYANDTHALASLKRSSTIYNLSVNDRTGHIINGSDTTFSLNLDATVNSHNIYLAPISHSLINTGVSIFDYCKLHISTLRCRALVWNIKRSDGKTISLYMCKRQLSRFNLSLSYC